MSKYSEVGNYISFAKPYCDHDSRSGCIKEMLPNDFTDAWFIGFSPSITCGVWVGFDDHRTLGDKEEGSHVALPIWMQFMSKALADQPVENFPDSPLLTSPEVVNQILASTGTESLLAERAAASGAAPPAAGTSPAPVGAPSATATVPVAHPAAATVLPKPAVPPTDPQP